MLPVLDEDKCRESLVFVQTKYPKAIFIKSGVWAKEPKGCTLQVNENHWNATEMYFNQHPTGHRWRYTAQICQKG